MIVSCQETEEPQPANDSYCVYRKEVSTNDIMVIGHTDTGGSESYTKRISEKRAQAGYNWFISNGIKANRLKFRGDGESNPSYFPGSSPRNRRIELLVIMK